MSALADVLPQVVKPDAADTCPPGFLSDQPFCEDSQGCGRTADRSLLNSGQV